MDPSHRESHAAPSALERLASFAFDVDATRLPAEVTAKAKDCVVDALSACLTIGSTLEARCAIAVVGSQQAPGTATIFGTPSTAPPGDAAFVNGTAAAGTSRSDTHAATASHPGTVVVPAVLALAESRQSTGRSVIEAIVAGYEAMCRIGLALVTPGFASTFRPTGMIGPTAAAIAASRVMALDRERMRNAASLATHTASGLNEWANSGTSELGYHAGFAARNAVIAALLAEAGTVSAPTILEGSAGLLAGYGASARAGRLTEGLGRDYRILDIVHKPAPACIYVQTPCQVAQRIVRSHRFDAESIESVEIRVGQAAAAYPGCDHAGPVHDLQAAKMSIQFGVAGVLAARGIFDSNWRDFTDPRTRAIAARSIVIVDDELTAAAPAVGSRISVRLKDGGVVGSEQADFASMSGSELRERFMNAAAPVLGRAAAARALELVDRIEHLGSIEPLAQSLRCPARGPIEGAQNPSRDDRPR